MGHHFKEIYNNLQIPVIVCACRDDYPVVYTNVCARILLPRGFASEGGDSGGVRLRDVLAFEDEGMAQNFFTALADLGCVAGYRASVAARGSEDRPVTITANMIRSEGEPYLALYLFDDEGAGRAAAGMGTDVFSSAVYLATHAQDVDDAIRKILAFAGTQVQVSRVYIFEPVQEDTTRNTYEWCAPGVEPMIQNLQELKMSDYDYSGIIRGGLYVADDISELPENDAAILAAQNIKAIAIVPMTIAGTPLGYVGFDDCEKRRAWTGEEIASLRSIANLIASLLIRRNYERQRESSLKTMQTISDNINSVIYVNDIKTHEILFINKKFTADRGIADSSSLVGKKCWQVLQAGQTGPCSFCPIRRMLDADGNVVMENYSREFQNTVDKQWYYVRDSMIEWIDGRLVHMETAVNISQRKEYERQLERFASVDALTGTYNRMWGYKAMAETRTIALTADIPFSLVFIDVDGLKAVNDAYGHDAGDELLIDAVGVIRKNIRRGDLLCRWGGDEFLLLLQCETEYAEKIMRKIKADMETADPARCKPYRISISYGVTEFDKGSAGSIDEIVARADKIMYKNKMRKHGKT